MVMFADFEQCFFVKNAARDAQLRVTPSVYIWEKSNKNAYFRATMCSPGAT
jgi:hypothetical protein